MGNNIVDAFNGVLDNLLEAEEYKKLPPRGPRDLASLSDAELKAKSLNEHGEQVAIDNNYDPQNHKIFSINIEDSLIPKQVTLMTAEELDGINICGIDGSNQKVEKNSFYLILARAAIVNFKYTKGTEPPYFYTEKRDASAVTWVDGNIFKENIKEHTNNSLKTKDEDGANIFDHIKKDSTKPFLVGYDHSKCDKSPSSHALGWAVKFQQALELLCLEYIKTDEVVKTVCIKDGPLYSTSSSKNDTIEGLRPIIQWKNEVLICVSKRINDSKLLVETLCAYPDLLQLYFPDDEVSRDNILSIGTDSLLLQRILLPGHRTPLIKAVPIARKGICEKASEELTKDLAPLTCYYRGRTRPQTFIRMEIPCFMWERNKQMVEDAIRIVAWQHELGGNVPYIQIVADDLCQLQHEKELLELQTMAALSSKNLQLAEKY